MAVGSQVSVGEQRTARRFHWVLAGAPSGPDPRFDLDLAQFESAAVTPTQGALLPEWLLVIPRRPCLAVADMTPESRRDIIRCAEVAAKAIARVAGSVVVFEHGAGKFGSPNSCGVDQAHLHVVGLPEDFLDWAKEQTSHLAWTAADCGDPWSGVARGSDYILLIGEQRAWVAPIQLPTSQYLRRMVAAFLDQPNDWDYRQHPHAENARQTANLFSRAFRRIPAD